MRPYRNLAAVASGFYNRSLLSSLAFSNIERLTGGRLGTFDVVCPICSPFRKARHQHERKLRIWRNEPDFATLYCAHCGEKGHVRRDRRAPIDIARIGRLKADSAARDAEEAKRKQQYALARWGEATGIARTLAAIYLAGRYIDLPEGADGRVFRFHPNCPFGDETLPCLIALMRDITTDEPRGIRRIALTPAGKKIDCRALGPKAGAAVKISADVSAYLAIGEGPETVLAGMQRGFRPAWCLGDAHEIGSFPVLAGVRRLTILVDNDLPDKKGRRKGQESAKHCSDRWRAAGRAVRLVISDNPGEDINDVVMRWGT